jgi:hypothetical protein
MPRPAPEILAAQRPSKRIFACLARLQACRSALASHTQKLYFELYSSGDVFNPFTQMKQVTRVFFLKANVLDKFERLSQ